MWSDISHKKDKHLMHTWIFTELVAILSLGLLTMTGPGYHLK